MTFRERLSYAWHWPEKRDLFEPWERFRARHRWPVWSWGICAAAIYVLRFDSFGRHGDGLFSTQYLSSLLWAIPVSLAIDLAIICIWWLVLRARLLFAGLTALRGDVIRRSL